MHTNNQFICLTQSPLGLPPGIALATVRAGGVALLDGEFCRDVQIATRHFFALLDASRPEHQIGLRLTLAQLESRIFEALLDALVERPHWLLLCGWWSEGAASETPVRLTPSPKRRMLAEVTAASQLEVLRARELAVDGFLAKGHETGGWVGEESAFILAQRLLAATDQPVYVQGGIGPHTAAACRAGGAAGVVVDDALLLMPESPLPTRWRDRLRGASGQDAVVLGVRGRFLRALVRPGFKAAERLRTTISPDQELRWCDEAAATTGWGDPAVFAWPIGQGIGQAARMANRYKTTGRFLQAIEAHSLDATQSGARLRVLSPGGPLAVSHGTEFPTVQGPMTRVSDIAAFAGAVADAGGLPMVALALMQPSAVEKVLTDTRGLLGSRPWGVGILGFVPREIRQAQLEVILRIKPKFALIAGGRPDQAADLEREGIFSYLHVPTPNLARAFIEQGARRFVFEGRECGGHIGPLSSFALWEAMVDTLLEASPDRAIGELHLLFAGGIHDGRSAAMIEALTAPLAERGAKIGVLMGTAYLFTKEAVVTGALTEGFQQQALACNATVTLETGPGHASRCAVTPFVEEFFDTARRLRAEGRGVAEMAQALDELSLGRLRIAAKGIVRKGPELLAVDPQTQFKDGMYMIGQVAALRDRVVSIRELHESVCPPLRETAAPISVTAQAQRPPAAPSDIAIVGIGVILPKADTPQELWDNIITQVDAISEIPANRWDWRLYYDADPKARDKVYSKWGCFLHEVPFDPSRFGIPPKSLPSIDPIQLLALEVVRRALTDANYIDGDFDRENTSVVLGYSGGLGELGERYVARTELTGRLDDPSGEAFTGLPEWTEDSFPGILPNVSAGRVANRFDLGGANFTVDSACASSLTAVDVAVAQLESGRCNVAIAGGVDTKLSAFGYLCFSKTPALTPRDRSHPFDAAADGILLGEGVAAVILKRLSDAERDGDRIYAVIKAAASSSDGKALGLTAPRSSGQLKAFARAYDKAGFSAATIGFYEAHGTGTRLGDETELHSITEVLKAEGAPAKSCAVGSLKALIGHTKSAAGVAALIKAALSLHYQALPPQPSVETPLPSLADPESPVCLLRQAQPWLARNGLPRRAGVSAFGFGGTNCHCVLEEYPGNTRPGAMGGENWPCELILLSAADREELAGLVERLHKRLTVCDPLPPLRDLAYSSALRGATGPARLALVAENSHALLDILVLAAERLRVEQPGQTPPQICIGSGDDLSGKVAFLFPGQGAQYVGMAREAALYLQPMRDALTEADIQFAGMLPRRLSQYLFPPGLFTEEAAVSAERELTATEIAQPALAAAEAGYLEVLAGLGLRPDMVAGHSFGEFMALHAAGVFSRADLLRLARVRGESMAKAGRTMDGAMAAVNAPREQIEALLEGTGVVLANHNSPRQSVISGPATGIDAVLKQLATAGIRTHRLAVSGAFHSPLMQGSEAQLNEEIGAVAMAGPAIPVYSNIDARPYLADEETLRRQLTSHMLSSVEFVGQIDAMYEAGARWFVEVGPKGVLTGLVGQILAGRPHLALSVDGNGGGLRGLLMTLGALYAHGAELDALALFAGRDSRRLTLPELAELKVDAATSPPRWLVGGGGVRQNGEPLPIPISRRIRPAHANLDGATQEPAKVVSRMLEETMTMTGAPTRESIPLETPSRPADAPLDQATALAAYESYQETMRQFLSLQEQIMTNFLNGAPTAVSPPALEAKSGGASAVAATPTHPAVPSQPAPAPPVAAPAVPAISAAQSTHAAASAGFDREGLVATLVEVVSDCTGYPPEMVGSDHDLEAELGIDSIKRVEIIANIEKRLPPALSQQMGARMEEFTRVKNLNALADALLGAVGDSAPAPVPAATTSERSAGLDREGLIASLVEVVSDCTGYPPEMVGLDHDLEAELGIDSIKRVEIIANIEKRLPPGLAQDMTARMDELTRVKSLNALADALLGVVGGGAPAPAAMTSEPSASLDREGLIASLVEVVSDCTGYPPEMVGLDHDLEAELGIDSIKRVEIIANIEKRLPPGLAQDMTARMDELTRVKSLDALAEALLGAVGGSAPAPAPGGTASVPNRAPAASVQEEEVDRFVMRFHAAPVPPLRDPSAIRGLVLVTPDGLGVGGALVQRLSKAGMAASLLSREALDDRERLEAEIARLRAMSGPVAAVLHLSGLEPGELPANLDDWRRSARAQTKSLFHILQVCASDLRGTSGRILSASLLGGHYGRDGRCGPGLPLGAGASGMLKTCAIEWPEVTARTVDLDEAPADVIAGHLFDELLTEDCEAEIGYANGNRLVFYAAKEPVDPSVVGIDEPARGWVVLALGGGRGITAAVVEDLVEPGTILVLAGRSSLDEEEPAYTRGVEDTAELRKCLIAKAKGGNENPTPAQIDRSIRKLRRIREIRANLDELRGRGVQVEYHAIDVNDAATFVTLLDDVYQRHGRIDAVVQGVGIIEDKLLVDKHPESFDRVFDTKVDATYLLCRHLRPESLKLVVLFASVAGRTGNRGQIDYATANEVLNRCAWWMHANWPRTRVISVNWGPWAVTGMATEEVNRQFRGRGVIPIPPALGRRFMREEIRHGDWNSVELVAGIFATATREDTGSAPAATHNQPDDLPLLSQAPEVRKDGSLGLSYTFSLSRDLYLEDHRLSGTAVVPAAVAIELMAEVAQAGWPEWVVSEVQDVRVLRGIRLEHDNDVSVLVRARAAVHANADSVRVDVDIASADESFKHYRCAVLLRPALAGSVQPSDLPALSGGRSISRSEVYEQYCFHGPRFRLLEAVDRLSDGGVDGRLRPSTASEWIAGAPVSTRWILDPGIVDSLLQVIILWTQVMQNSYPLPSRFGRFLRSQSLPTAGVLRFVATNFHADRSGVRCDYWVLDESGNALLAVEGVEGTHSEALNRLSPRAADLLENIA